ncbi:hypothetical protein GCM10019016_063190 [Streptomyces prasinosporus]|uniref:Response regulatory domain-containing protein n=1 Tax=Streptomyces prasinosporus TaxID=68256 RepID=A0ABP6TWI5_9ACTN
MSAAGSGPAALRCLERAAAEGRRFDVLLVDADLGVPAPGRDARPCPVQAVDEDGAVDGHLAGRGGVRAAQQQVRVVVLAEKDDPRPRRPRPAGGAPPDGSPRTAR